MHFLYICPSGNFHRDFLAYFFLYMSPKTQGNAHEKGNVPHTETFPLSFMYLFFQFCQFIAVHIRRMTALIMAC